MIWKLNNLVKKVKEWTLQNILKIEDDLLTVVFRGDTVPCPFNFYIPSWHIYFLIYSLYVLVVKYVPWYTHCTALLSSMSPDMLTVRSCYQVCPLICSLYGLVVKYVLWYAHCTALLSSMSPDMLTVRHASISLNSKNSQGLTFIHLHSANNSPPSPPPPQYE